MRNASIRVPRRPGQRGSALFFSLIALVALALASVALVRSVDTGTLVMGNLGFKQDATASSDQAAEAAVAWLTANLAGTTLNNNNVAAGYYASSLDALDAAGNGTDPDRALVDWNDDGCAYGGGFTGACIEASPPATYNGNTASYVITRLCVSTGPSNAVPNSCVTPITKVSAEAPGRGGISYVTERLNAAGGSPYYRILVRSVSGRGTVSYTETVLHYWHDQTTQRESMGGPP